MSLVIKPTINVYIDAGKNVSINQTGSIQNHSCIDNKFIIQTLLGNTNAKHVMKDVKDVMEQAIPIVKNAIQDITSMKLKVVV